MAGIWRPRNGVDAFSETLEWLRSRIRPEQPADLRLTRRRQITFDISAEIEHDTEDDVWLVALQPIDVHTFGETEEEALDNARDALESWLLAFTPDELIDELRRRGAEPDVKPVQVPGHEHAAWVAFDDSDPQSSRRGATAEMLVPA